MQHDNDNSDKPAPKLDGLRFNMGKPRMSLVPSALNRYAAFGFTYGEIKYTVVDEQGAVVSRGTNNWRKGFRWSEIIDSLERHLTDFKEGDDIDGESGLPQLALMACNLSFLIEHYDRKLGVDDRFIQPEPAKPLKFNIFPPTVQKTKA